MSRINGTRSRFDRVRKARMHDRERIRKIREALKPKEAVQKLPSAQA